MSLLFGVAAAYASPVHAQSSGAQAEELFRQGKELMAAGKIAEACGAFAASQKLEPTIATLLNEANCREQNGQLATAWGLFLDAERQTRTATDDAAKQFHDTAAERAAKLESRVSRFAIHIAPEAQVPGLEITRGTDVTDPNVWNRTLPIDGGTYAIGARAPGFAPWTGTVTIGREGDAKSIDVPKLAPAPVGGAGAPSAEMPVVPREDATYPYDRFRGAVGAGLGFGFITNAKSEMSYSIGLAGAFAVPLGGHIYFRPELLVNWLPTSTNVDSTASGTTYRKSEHLSIAVRPMFGKQFNPKLSARVGPLVGFHSLYVEQGICGTSYAESSSGGPEYGAAAALALQSRRADFALSLDVYRAPTGGSCREIMQGTSLTGVLEASDEIVVQVFVVGMFLL